MAKLTGPLANMPACLTDVPVLCLLDLRGRLRRQKFHSVYAKKNKNNSFGFPKHSKEFVVLC